MHGQHTAVGGGPGIGVKHLMKGRAHLLEAVGELHLPRKCHLVAAFDLVSEPGLAKEARGEDTRRVDHVELHHCKARSGSLEFDLVDGSHNGDLAAHVRMADGHHVGVVHVAMGHMEEEVAYAVDAKPLQSIKARRGAA